MLKIWLLGHINEIRSSRKLERACKEMIGMLWLTGMISPDHNTLWRFLKRHQEAISKLLVQSTRLARRAGLLGMRLHAVDGTKIQGRGSRESVIRQKLLAKELEEIEKEVAEYLEDVAEAEEQEEGAYRLPEDLADKEKRKQWIKEMLEEMKRSGTKVEHTTEPEAREMKSQGKCFFGFNAQAVVDISSGLIVAEDVTNEQNDMHQLVPMVRLVNKNLKATAENTLADGGYVTLAQVSTVYDEGFNVTLDLPKKYRSNPEGGPPYREADFVYDQESQVLLCPLGKSLTFNGTKNERWGKYRERVYRCKGSKKCPHKHLCSAARRGNGIAISPFQEAMQVQREKFNKPEVKETLRHRRKVETCFGNIKENRGFRRFTTWGLSGAKTQWSLLCTTNNLMKIYHHWAKQVVIKR